MVLNKDQVEQIKNKLLEQLEKLPEENRKAIKKQIEGMDAVQLESFLKENAKMDECIFCSIVEGKQKSYKIYEDENFLGVLSIRPLAKGHILLISKEHTIVDDKILLMEELGKMLGGSLENIFKGVKVKQTLETLSGHRYLSIYPIFEKEEEIKVSEDYFLEMQTKIVNSLNLIPKEKDEKTEEIEKEGKILPKVGSRIP